VSGKINLYLPILVDTIKNKPVPLDLVSASILLCGSILGKTWRLSVTGTTLIDPFHDRDKGVIYCFWHAHILPMAYIFRGIGVKAVVSDSKDGDRATAVAQRWRHETIRGSSSLHGISVIRACVRELKRGQNIVFVPDGPRGPREIVKPGIAQIALLAGASVFPVIALPKNPGDLILGTDSCFLNLFPRSKSVLPSLLSHRTSKAIRTQSIHLPKVFKRP